MKVNFGQKMNFDHAIPGMKKAIQPVTNEHSKKRDFISIGSQARQLFNGGQQKNSLIENLMKQRENIQEMKSNMTERAIENGKDLSAIEEQLKNLEEQITEIDAQIAQAQKGKEDSSTTSKAKETESKTIEEAIFSQAGSLEQVKTLGRVDQTLTREKETLESQIKMDANRGIHSEFKADRLTKLDEQISTVQEALAEKVDENRTTLNEVAETTKEDTTVPEKTK